MQFQIGNPIGGTTLLGLLDLIINGIIFLATPIIVLMVIYAGFLFVWAQGNTERLTDAKNAITYALLGALILLGAHAISAIIQGTIAQMAQ
jgi:hypothetical protein